MRNLLLREIGLVWDKLGGGKHMDKFWNVNCIDPWNTWSVGLFDAPLCTPSNNTQEAIHTCFCILLYPDVYPNVFLGYTRIHQDTSGYNV